jgi:cell wall-associated NlpC family hydrolase
MTVPPVSSPPIEVQRPPTPRPRSDESTLRRQRAVDLAIRQLGVPYRWGGASRAGFDCSGLVQYVYAKVGIPLPHNTAQQYGHGTPVARDALAPGDLVFFDRLRHDGIYIGRGRFIHARRTGKRVTISDLDEEWYRARWVGARRP